jgi:hypothetical protein
MRVAIGRELRGGICHPKQSEAINVAVTFAREMPSEAIKCNQVQSSAIKCNQCRRYIREGGAIRSNQVQSSAINVAVTFAREMPPVGIHVMVVYGAERALSIVRPPNGSAGKNLR